MCPGSRLSFRCSTNLTLLEWIITISQSGRPTSEKLAVTAETRLDLNLVIDGHVFNISRNSPYLSYPLVSVLTISNAVATLTATKINCTGRAESAERSSSIAIIDIIDCRLMNKNKNLYLSIFQQSIQILLLWEHQECWSSGQTAL